MNKEELLKEIMKLPKVETNNPISTMTSINIDDLMSAIDRLNKVPDYNDLLKENQELKKRLEEYKDKINWYENFEVNKTIDKLRLKHNAQQKEFIKYLEDYIEEMEEEIGNSITEPYKESHTIRRNVYQEVLLKYKEIIGDKR